MDLLLANLQFSKLITFESGYELLPILHLLAQALASLISHHARRATGPSNDKNQKNQIWKIGEAASNVLNAAVFSK